MTAAPVDTVKEPRVTIIRRSADGKNEHHLIRDVPLQSIFSGRAEDPMLQAKDVVFVNDAAQPEPPKGAK